MVREAYHVAIEMLGKMSSAAAELLEEAEADALTYLDFPMEHRRRLRTNNAQERSSREIKRRSRMVQVFPSAKSLIWLVGLVCVEIDEKWSSRCYIVPGSTALLNEECPKGTPQQATDGDRERAERLIDAALESATKTRGGLSRNRFDVPATILGR